MNDYPASFSAFNAAALTIAAEFDFEAFCQQPDDQRLSEVDQTIFVGAVALLFDQYDGVTVEQVVNAGAVTQYGAARELLAGLALEA